MCKLLVGVVVAAMAMIGVIGCGGGSTEIETAEVKTTEPETAEPETTNIATEPGETVEAWIQALAAKDSEKLTVLHIPELRDLSREAYDQWVALVKAAPEISISNLSVEPISQTEEKAELAAKYELGIGAGQTPVKTGFRLESRNGAWLITGLSGYAVKGLSGWIEVLVSDAQGPVPGAQVTIFTADGSELHGMADNEGMAIIEGALEAENIVASKEGYSQEDSGYSEGLYSIGLRPVIWLNQFLLRTATGGRSVGQEETISFQPGEKIEIEAIIKWNHDISPTTHEVELTVNGELHGSVNLDLPDASGRDQVSVHFTLSFDEKGAYEIEAEGVIFTAVVE